MKKHEDINDTTHTTTIDGAKILTVSGRGVSFWAIKLTPDHIACYGNGTDDLCLSGNIEVEGGMVAFLEAVNAWAAMGCPLVCDMLETFPCGMRKWAKQCHSDNLFLLERDKVK